MFRCKHDAGSKHPTLRYPTVRSGHSSYTFYDRNDHQEILCTSMTAIEDEDDPIIPLREQRYFGAGLKRKRVQFVPSSASVLAANPATSNDTVSSVEPQESPAEKYLRIVFKKAAASSTPSTPSDHQTSITADNGRIDSGSSPYSSKPSDSQDAAARHEICATCHYPISPSQPHPHETTLPHQLRLPHSHPPSALDRTRKGLIILRDQGWDPDDRLGLGSQGEGRLYPVKGVEKRDREGVGSRLLRDDDDDDRAGSKRRQLRGGGEKRRELEDLWQREGATKLDAGKVRKMESLGKKKAEALREAFYQSEEVQRYLGGG